MHAESLTPFVPFGQAHLIGVAVALAVGVGLPLAARRLPEPWHWRIAAILAACMLAQEVSKMVIRSGLYDYPLHEHLPLHLCGIALLASAVMLWRRSYRLYEVCYFWALGASIPALLTPDLQQGFPHPLYFVFFVGHGLVFTGAMYATLVYRFRPRLRSIGITAVATIALMILIAPVNVLLGTNYFYLRHKPLQPSIMDFLGPWPWYVAGLVGVGVVVCVICYLPFAFGGRRRHA